MYRTTSSASRTGGGGGGVYSPTVRSALNSGGISKGGWTSCSFIMQALVMLAFSMIIFMMGVTVGLQYFDTHITGPGSLPPGLVAGNQPLPQHLRLSKEAEEEITDNKKTAIAKTKPVDKLGKPEILSTTGPETYAIFTGHDLLPFEGVFDDGEISGGAWIYMDSTISTKTINTIFSNRDSGCTIDDNHRGYTFYVNNWETSDGALVIEYRDRATNGCGRLSTDPNTIPVDTWVHVGFAFQAPKNNKEGKIMLFLNGKLVKSGSTERNAIDAQSDRNKWTIGGTPDRQFYFSGRIGSVFISKGVISPRQLAATAKLIDANGMVELVNAAKNRLLAAIILGNRDQPISRGDDTHGSFGLDDTDIPVYMASSSMNMMTELTGNGVPKDSVLVSGKRATAKEETEDLVPQNVETTTSTTSSNTNTNTNTAPKVNTNQKTTDGGKVPASIRRNSIPGNPSGSGFDFTSGRNQWIPQLIRVPAEYASGSTNDAAALAAGTFSDDVTQEQLEESDREGRTRALKIKGAMQHIWKNYKAHAYGSDELKPRSGHGDNNWGNVGMTLIDSLDTLWVMDMKEEFNEAKEWVRSNLNFERHGATSVFEITIRALGGLLAAFDLSKDNVFLQKAKDLGDRLLPAFNTPSGIPRAQITLATGWTSNPSWTGGAAILAELGTLQVEFRYLSKATGQSHYGEKAEAVIEKMDRIHPTNGLFPIYVSTDSGTPTTGAITFGALGDSFYEYLIKVWVQGGRKESMYRRMYDAAMDGMTNQLLKRSNPSKLAYVADWDGGGTVDKMDHLVCFVPGMLALGAYTAAGTDGEADAVRDLTNAKALAYTCWQMYERQATGIAPEFVEFPGGSDLVASPRAPFYILRPEAAESLYILHQLTGNPIYREWGWKMFSAIDRYCKTEFGYGAHPDVRDTNRIPDDRMESFFMAETLKYLYMLQSPDHPISLDKYVFNTEAHPLSIFT